MPKWEYAAIVRGKNIGLGNEGRHENVYNWYLVKPGNEPHLHSERKKNKTL